jgi:hypothetical protein
VQAQLSERKRHISALSEFTAHDPGPFPSVFRQALEQLGWLEDRNVVIDYRFAGGCAMEINLTNANYSAMAPASFRSVARLRGASGVLGGIVMRDFNRTAMQCTWLISSAPLAGEPMRSRVR